MVFMRTNVGRRHLRDEQGAIAVLTALLMVGLILCAAIVVDLGNARDVRRQSQNAADASALAAVNVLYPGLNSAADITSATQAARDYVDDNLMVTLSAADWTTCRDSSKLTYHPFSECISFDGNAPTKVRVTVPTRTVATFFGGIAGIASIPVGSFAEAQLGPSVTCSLCFLGDVDAGNGDFSVSGGSIAVNGNVTTGPNSYWTASSIGIVGTFDSDAHPSIAVRPIPAFGDPLAGLTLPLSTTGLSAKTNPCSATATGGPGLYGAFSLPNSACPLQPGLYVISGTWNMGNNTVLSGNGVTLYVKSPSGYLDFKNGIVTITAPSTGVGAGYAIIYDRNNTNNLGLQGNGGTSISGAVYAPASILDFNGNSCFGFRGGPIVLNGATTNGNTSCVTITDAVSTTVSRGLLHLNE